MITESKIHNFSTHDMTDSNLNHIYALKQLSQWADIFVPCDVNISQHFSVNQAYTVFGNLAMAGHFTVRADKTVVKFQFNKMQVLHMLVCHIRLKSFEIKCPVYRFILWL